MNKIFRKLGVSFLGLYIVYRLLYYTGVIAFITRLVVYIKESPLYEAFVNMSTII